MKRTFLKNISLSLLLLAAFVSESQAAPACRAYFEKAPVVAAVPTAPRRCHLTCRG